MPPQRRTRTKCAKRAAAAAPCARRRGVDRCTLTRQVNGDVHHHVGPRGAERLVRIEAARRHLAVCLDGPRGAERAIRLEYDEGGVAYMEGVPGEERKVREELPSGAVMHYEGPAGAESLVRVVSDVLGHVLYYEGSKDNEYIVRTVFADGTEYYYQGPRDAERRVRAVLADGSTTNYVGPQGREHIVSRVWPDGTEFHYTGQKGAEWRTCIVHPDGRVEDRSAQSLDARAALRAVMEAVDEAKAELPEGRYLQLADLTKAAWEAAA